MTDQYRFDPLSRDTFNAIAFNAVGRASEVNNLDAYSLSHSTGNSGWSIGFMEAGLMEPTQPTSRLSVLNKATTGFADPEGGVHGCTPFFDRAMDGESKNPHNNETALTL